MVKQPQTVLLEGVFVGLFLIVFIYISSALLMIGGYPMKKMLKECEAWNDTYVMESTAFLAGFLFHLTFEYAGINEWYAKNYSI